MPRGDGTGPEGRSQGYGRGQGRGGRGWRNWPVGIEQTPPADAPSVEGTSAIPIAPVAADSEVALLRGQIQECQQAIAALNERILQLSENARERSALKEPKQRERDEEGSGEEPPG